MHGRDLVKRFFIAFPPAAPATNVVHGKKHPRATMLLMSVDIIIRNVPDEVRDELAGRAARQGRSLQEYL
jgi:hypothetical protein